MGLDFDCGRACSEPLGYGVGGGNQRKGDIPLQWLNVDDGLCVGTDVDQDFGITGDGDHIRISAYAGVR